MYFRKYIDSSRQWRWTLYAGNNKKIANSGESYHNEADCLHAINLVRSANGNTPIK